MEFETLERQKEKLLNFFAKCEKIKRQEIRFVAVPYRICPLGAHIDHQGGPVLGMTINTYTLLAYYPLPGPEIRLYSMNYDGKISFRLQKIGPANRQSWGRYAMGAAKVLGNQFSLRKGMAGAVLGTLPASGLSSSASVGLAYLHALARINNISLSAENCIKLDQQLENKYLGLKNGLLDQTTIIFGQKNHLLSIDTLHLRVKPLPLNPSSPKFRILIAYSGFSRELTGTGFNNRVEECRRAAELLAASAGLRSASRLSDVPLEVFNQYCARLPQDLQRRAHHFFSERQRVEDGQEAWCEGNLAAFGRLMNESCMSSIEQYESGSPALKTLWEIMSTTPYVFGSRFAGGGYGGCVLGFVAVAQARKAAEIILEKYQKAYPEIKDQASLYLADTENGVRHL